MVGPGASLPRTFRYTDGRATREILLYGANIAVIVGVAVTATRLPITGSLFSIIIAIVFCIGAIAGLVSLIRLTYRSSRPLTVSADGIVIQMSGQHLETVTWSSITSVSQLFMIGKATNKPVTSIRFMSHRRTLLVRNNLDGFGDFIALVNPILQAHGIAILRSDLQAGVKDRRVSELVGLETLR